MVGKLEAYTMIGRGIPTPGGSMFNHNLSIQHHETNSVSGNEQEQARGRANSEYGLRLTAQDLTWDNPKHSPALDLAQCAC